MWKNLFTLLLGFAIVFAYVLVIPSFAYSPTSGLNKNLDHIRINKKTAETKPILKRKIFIPVKSISQLPELISGCEVTTLTMLLDFAGEKMNKLEVAKRIEYDPTPKITDKYNQYEILTWGNPDKGFVGKMTGPRTGFGVYHAPLFRLLNKLLPNQAVDLTGQSFENILQSVSNGLPVIAWTTTDFSPARIWEDWNSPSGKVHATFKEHTVLIVGYDDHFIYVNDPLDGSAGKKVNRKVFELTWKQMGEQAITLRSKVK